MVSEDKEKAEKTKLLDHDFGQKKKYDKNFKGPIKDRGCTDIICCVLFSVYMIGMIIVGIVAYIQGDPKRLLFPTDSSGKVCGVDIIGKNFLHYFDLTKCITKGTVDPFAYARNGLACPTPKVCVSKCPHLNNVGFDVPYDEMVCIAGVQIFKNTSDTEKKKLVRDGKCSPFYLESQPFFYRCVPTMLSSAISSLGIVNIDGTKVNGSNIELGKDALRILLNFRNVGMKIADELKVVWVWILIGFILSMVVSMLYIVLARWITFPLVVFTALGVLGLLGYGMYYSFVKYKYLVDTQSSVDIVWRMSIQLNDFTANKNAWLTLGIFLVVLFLILFLLMIFLMHRVRIACELIAETSRAVCSMLSTLFFPLLPWILQLAWFGWFIVVLLFLMSNGIKEYQVSADDSIYNLTMGKACSLKTFYSLYPKTNVTCLFAKYGENVNLFRFQVFHLFGWLWGSQFIIAFTECSLAGAFASYYWAMRKPQDIPSFPVLGGMWRSLSYHTGSLALGAAIVAIVKLIRITLEYIDQKLKQNTNNPVASFIMKCLKCCFWCLEKCLRFLNKNAYIMIAIYGRNFCASAKESFSLLIRNPARALTINGITGFVLFLGKLLVTGGVAVASFFWFSKYNASQPDKLQYSIVPLKLIFYCLNKIKNNNMTGVETKIFLSTEIISFLKAILNDVNAAAALKAKVRVALSQPNTGKQAIAYEVLTEAHQFYSTFKCPSTSKNFIDLHNLVKTSKIFVENVPEPVRSPELINRLERLRREQNQREYDKMVKNVRTKTENFSQEIGLAIRTTGQQVMSIVNFLLSIIAAFAFAYFSSQFAFSGDLAMRIIFSVIVATIVALAELYFMAKIEI